MIVDTWTGGKGILRAFCNFARSLSLSLAHTLDLTLVNSLSLDGDDLDLVEGVAETVGSSVQLQLARRLESVRGLGGPLLGSGLPRGSRDIVVVVVLGSDRSRSNRGRLVVVVGVDRSWLNWSRSWGLTRVLLAEGWVVPARIVLSIVVSLVVVATSAAAERRLVLWLRLVLSLGLVLRLRGSGSMWWRSWGYWQMVSRSLESILASDVGDGSSLSGRVNVAVRAAAVTVGVRFLLEVGSVLLIVRSTKLAIAGKVALLAQDRRRLRVTVVSALVLRGRRNQQR